MKVKDLTKLSYQRLQKYRKSLTDKQHDWEWYEIGENVFDELKRVLMECQRRNRIIISKQNKDKWAHVPTIKEF